MDCEVLVLGKGEAGREAAIAAARVGRTVTLVEPATGSNVAADVVLEAARRVVSRRRAASRAVTMADVRRTVDELLAERKRCERSRLEWHGVDVVTGDARFVDAETVAVSRSADELHLRGERIVVATGSRARRRSWVPFDGECVFDTEDVLSLEALPQSMLVVGDDDDASVWAAAFAALGVRVTWLSREMVALSTPGVVRRGGVEVAGIERTDAGVVVTTRQGEAIRTEAVLFADGRMGDTASLDLAAVGLEADETGRLWCDESFRTWVDHVFAIGDVVGFPGIDGDTAEQCEHLTAAAFGRRTETETVPAPHAIGFDLDGISEPAGESLLTTP